MGAKSCKASCDNAKVKSPLFGCILGHCDCSCIQEEVKEVVPAVIAVEAAAHQLQDLEVTLKELFGIDVIEPGTHKA
jgi:hypothetical protein